MSAGKRSTRAGVAAVALGLSLAGSGAAAADAPDGDASSVADAHSASTGAGPAAGGPSVSRPVDPGPAAGRRGRPARHPAAATGSVVAAPPEVVRPRRGTGPQSSVLRPDNSGPSAAAAQSAGAQPAIATRPDGNVPAVIAPASPAAVVAASTGGRRPAAGITGLPGIFAGSPPPALAKPIAAIGTAVNTFFDSAAHWLSELPATQLTHFLEGALLLMRRTFFNAFPVLAGQTTSQTADAYFTRDQMRAYLLDLAKQQYGGLFGTTVPVYGYGGPYSGPYPYAEYLKMQSDAASGTNTQVASVDEADFVETDGHYIYTAHNGSLTITGTDLSVASQSALAGDVQGEYLSGDRLTVITRSGTGWYAPYIKMAYPGFWAPWNPQTTVTVYDVSDRTAPAVVSQTTFDGAYQDSRAVDGVVYVVMQRSVNLPAPQYTDTPIQYVNGTGGQGDPAPDAMIRFDPNAPVAMRTYETWDEYVARVGERIVDLSLPHAYSVDAQGHTIDLGLVAGAQDIVRPHSADQQSLLTVASVDSGTPAGGLAFADSVGTMVSANGGTVYMTPDALYVGTAEDHYSGDGSSTDTRIDRFTLAGPNVSWQATGLVSGTVINQFAMDENGGRLRVATHTAQGDNGIHVLDTTGSTLDEVGSITGLAPGEQLYAVRYVGDTAYLVTFVRTDPLFAVELGDPAAPRLLGELEVPGFSNYLQSVGDGLLLGIGQEREAGTWNTHLQATLFNVTDGTAMAQVDRVYLDPGYQWSWSDAQFDHHALLYSAEDGLLVVPVSGSGYDPDTGYRSAQYLKVLRLGPNGIDVIGEIHPAEPTLRTVRIGDVLYAVGDTSVTAYRISDLSEVGSSAASQTGLA